MIDNLAFVSFGQISNYWRRGVFARLWPFAFAQVIIADWQTNSSN